MENSSSTKFVIGVDIGTTYIRSYVYDNTARVRGKSYRKVNLLYPDPNCVEMEPNQLWENFKEVIDESLQSSQLKPQQMSCLGISTQRNTFVTWDKHTGLPYHNFITWKDRRTTSMCDSWNSSFRMRIFRLVAWILFIFTRSKRFLAASMLRFSSSMVLMRLVWILENIIGIKEKCNRNEVLFGTIDTWLVWKLTKGNVHATDGSNASATGLFDPFQMKWSDFIINMFNIPTSILPCIKQTSDSFGSIHPDIFGYPIPICAVVGDQQSSMFGKCCFNNGDINCTLGTGAFVCINTGLSPLVSRKESIYPLVAWTVKNQTTYLAESGVCQTGNLILWAQSIGLFQNPEEISEVALSILSDTDVYFLCPPEKSIVTKSTFSKKSAFVGVTLETSKADLIRALLEAVAFQICSLFQYMVKELNFCIKTLSVSGGVSNNDFIIQVMSDVLSTAITRTEHFDSSSLGAAFLAGLFAGIWNHTDELSAFHKDEQNFIPREEFKNAYKEKMSFYKKVLSKWNSWNASL